MVPRWFNRNKDDIEDEILETLDEGAENGLFREEGVKMIRAIFDFDDKLAHEIMTPRTDVFMIDIQDEPKEYTDELMEMHYSRVPVYDGDVDNIIGILHVKDYFIEAYKGGFESVEIGEILRKPYFVPETKNINKLFYELQKEKQHIAILIDEYGGFSGIVTMEDLIEEIMGDIDDEYDEEENLITKIDEDTYIVDGNISLFDFNDELEVELESDNSETLGGYIIELLGEIPDEESEEKPEIVNGEFTFVIESVRDRRIDKVRVTVDRSYEVEE